MSGGSENRDDDEIALRDSVVEAVAGAYYAREITAPDTVRNRAERSATIAGAIGATLLGAGVISGIGGRSLVVTTLGFVALAAWASSAALFVRAVASPVDRDLPPGQLEDVVFVKTALGLARKEVETVNARHKQARRVAVVAAVLTLASLALASFDLEDPHRRTLALTERGAETLAIACPDLPPASKLRVDIRPSTLKEDFVVFSPIADSCSGEIELDRDDVVAVLP